MMTILVILGSISYINVLCLFRFIIIPLPWFILSLVLQLRLFSQTVVVSTFHISFVAYLLIKVLYFSYLVHMPIGIMELSNASIGTSWTLLVPFSYVAPSRNSSRLMLYSLSSTLSISCPPLFFQVFLQTSVSILSPQPILTFVSLAALGLFCFLHMSGISCLTLLFVFSLLIVPT